jgi:hypothetical protein
VSTIQEIPSIFPAVTICNVNKFNEKYAENYLLNLTSLSKCFQFTDGNLFNKCTNSNLTSETFDEVLDIIQRTIANNNLSYNASFNYGYQLKREMLISCNFNGETCYPKDFLTLYNQQYGNCFTFNMQPTQLYHEPYADNNTNYRIRYTSKPGAEQGLQLEILTCK